MQRLTTSWREASLAQTRSLAERTAPALGITRVADITWLDRIGIPVSASIRPNAIEGSLCVNAGKGSTTDEARVGALMEAIEFAAAEDNRHELPVIGSTPAQIAGQPGFGPFMDFCPVWGAPIDPNAPLDAIVATSVWSGERALLPAELIFSPFPRMKGQAIFGTSTNGLCSGNTLQEAALHGLCEVLERDILAFNCVMERSFWVDQEVLPPAVRSLVEKIHAAGMSVALRCTPNDFGLPFLQAFLLADEGDPIAIALGSGLHLSSEVAAIRAITEAAQGRLSYIHGGRDDLTERAEFFSRKGPGAEARATAQLRKCALSRNQQLAFSQIPEVAPCGIVEGLSVIRARLRVNGIARVWYVDLSPPSCPLTVLKVVVPGLESFSTRVPRIGPRLIAFMRQVA